MQFISFTLQSQKLLIEVVLPGLEVSIDVFGSVSLAKLHDRTRSHLLKQSVSKLHFKEREKNSTIEADW